MARKKIEINKDEINEIIELYIEKELNGIIDDLSGKGITKFNEIIANNPEYKRKDGSLFSCYKYNTWAGTYNGEDNYGKARIKEIKNNNSVKVAGPEFDAQTIDIVQLVNDMHDKPEKLINYLSKLFSKERDKNKNLKKKLKNAETEKERLQKELQLFQTAMYNFIYQSQYPSNSLTDMINLKKDKDNYCYLELKNMFSNNKERIRDLIGESKTEYNYDNVIDFNCNKENYDQF